MVGQKQGERRTAAAARRHTSDGEEHACLGLRSRVPAPCFHKRECGACSLSYRASADRRRH